jgi:group I intron endonuclease
MNYNVKTPFMELYDELSNINEINLYNILKEASDNGEPVIEIKGHLYNTATQFMPITDITRANMSKPGVYVWWRLPYENMSSAYYVGQAVNIYNRTKQHTYTLAGDSTALTAAIKKYGLKQFKIAVLEFCHRAELNNRECKWIEKLDTYHSPTDYNLTPGGQNSGGHRKVTVEMFEQIINYLQDTSSAAITMHEIGRRLGLDKKTIHSINAGTYIRTEEFINRLNLNVTFPIRSAEQVQQITKAAQRAGSRKKAEKTSKAWKLTLTHNSVSDAGTVIKTAVEDLGTFAGRPAVCQKVSEIEQTVYKTPKEEIDKSIKNLFRGNRPAASFIPLTPKKYARRYTIHEIN